MRGPKMSQGQLFELPAGPVDRDCWATPDGLWRELDREFGFTLDVCALSWSAKCAAHYTPETDGLTQNWAVGAGGGSCWCNPPFSDLAPWAAKALLESRRGATVVMILPAHRVEQAWFHDNVLGYAEIRYLRGRVAYVPPPGVASSSPEFPSLLAIYRPSVPAGGRNGTRGD